MKTIKNARHLRNSKKRKNWNRKRRGKHKGNRKKKIEEDLESEIEVVDDMLAVYKTESADLIEFVKDR